MPSPFATCATVRPPVSDSRMPAAISSSANRRLRMQDPPREGESCYMSLSEDQGTLHERGRKMAIEIPRCPGCGELCSQKSQFQWTGLTGYCPCGRQYPFTEEQLILA